MPGLSQKFEISPSQRAIFLGRTGSGKTYLASRLLMYQQNVIALDSKGTLKIPGFDLVRDPRKLASAAQRYNVVFRPPWNFSPEELDKVFVWVLRRGHTLLYIDELYAVASEYTRPNSPLGGIVTRGRELGIGLWSATQRPSRIPLWILSEAEHSFVFSLRLKNDRLRVEEALEDKIPWQTIETGHGFWYNRLGRGGNGPYRLTPPK